MMHAVATSLVDILLHAFGKFLVRECPMFVCVFFGLHPVFKRVVDDVFAVSSRIKHTGTEGSANSVASVLEATCNAE